MKIVTLCDEGNNRSVTFAFFLRRKYKAEVIPVGFLSTSRSTRKMLYDWADIIICLVPKRAHWIPEEYKAKVKVWIGVDPDIYPRGFNPFLRMKARSIIESNPL